MPKLRIAYNAPVVLTFALAACVVQLMPVEVKMWCTAQPELHDARSYVGLFTHILGHGDWNHLLSNFSFILLLGPILEERHGSRQLLVMILLTALVTGLVNLVIGNEYLLGASGIVFMMIVLASTANIRAGEIPLTFVAVVVIFIGRELYNATKQDNISQLAHVIGGLAGGAFGFLTARPAAKVKLPAVATAGPAAAAVPRRKPAG